MKTKPNSIPHAIGLCVLALGLPALAKAQTTRPTSPDPETVELSPFQITASQDESYGAIDSITGSRIRTAIKELPFSVNVVTDTLMNELSAYSLEEQLAYTSSFSPGESDQDYQLRGIASSRKLRNGFVHVGISDKLTVDRTEVIKGAVASIYGQTQPGGIVNTITKRPRDTAQIRLGTQVGSFDFIRTEVLATGPLVPGRVNYLAGAAWQQNGNGQDFYETRRAYGAGMLEFILGSRTKLLVEGELLKTDGNAESPLYYDYEPRSGTTSPRVATRYNIGELLTFNNNGPFSFDNRNVATLAATLEHGINSVWTLKSGLSYYDFDRERFAFSGDLFQTDIRQITGRNPTYIYSDGSRLGAQTDLLAQFESASIKHRLLVTLDLARMEDSEFRRQLPAGWNTTASNPYFALRNISIDNPVYTMPPVSALTNRFRDQESTVDSAGLFVSEQMFLLRDRLLLMGGARYDYADFDTRDYSAGVRNNYTDSDVTYQVGANFAIVPSVRVYANYSTSFYPQARLSPEGEPYPNEQGEGLEAGIKTNLLNDKIIVTTNVFKATRDNIVIRTVDSSGLDVYLMSGAVESQGAEVDFNFTPIKGLQIFGGYGYVDAEYVRMEDARLVGLAPTRVPRHNFGTAIRYEVQSGFFRRFYFLVSQRSQSAARGSDSSSALRYLVEQPAFSVWNAGAGFKLTDKRGIYHKVQVSVKNLTDEAYLTGRRPGAGLGWTLRYDVQF